MMIHRRTLSSLIGALVLALMSVLLPGPFTIAAAIAGPADMAPVNAMDRAAFVQKFGGIFENSPWVAEQAWEKRPFASLDDMHAAMVAVAKYAPATLQLTLLQSHPDLAGKEAQAGAMTASSVAEQASAGLNALSHDEMTQISNLNAAYKKKFGFPFIIAVRMHTKEGILFEFNRRLQNDTQTEFANDLQNVYIITRLRLNKLLDAS
ncbi:2-oxo-4-hydroxy-4-carboxy-5-ureidoimidazoline decarboxylase [Bradyrhizobium sp. dw_411]|uniref:2-oxo-4-hydroxy-4-carboxy-5-ureidoimidazoline decarboxylase n=1 Tax=Bradyrhizobium sp. dw_411 TaxID=2720082 RepID=UPI001BCE06A0|nr:2-oxo-4-hydroxy-4-carboxy-5-ureidoimidazoline decarboxylase [Bradyrhizobium sp. dw_411]